MNMYYLDIRVKYEQNMRGSATYGTIVGEEQTHKRTHIVMVKQLTMLMCV